jgi:hypothetical protein
MISRMAGSKIKYSRNIWSSLHRADRVNAMFHKFAVYRGLNLIKYASHGTGTRTLHNDATEPTPDTNVIGFAHDSLV